MNGATTIPYAFGVLRLVEGELRHGPPHEAGLAVRLRLDDERPFAARGRDAGQPDRTPG